MARYEETALIAVGRLVAWLKEQGSLTVDCAARAVASISLDGCSEQEWDELADHKKSYYRGRAGVFLNLLAWRLPISRDNGNWIWLEGASEGN